MFQIGWEVTIAEVGSLVVGADKRFFLDHELIGFVDRSIGDLGETERSSPPDGRTQIDTPIMTHQF